MPLDNFSFFYNTFFKILFFEKTRKIQNISVKSTYFTYLRQTHSFVFQYVIFDRLIKSQKFLLTIIIIKFTIIKIN